VEPLEASALQVIILQSRTLADTLVDADQQPSPTNIAMYNRFITQHWDDVRDFLAVHYRFNDRLDTPFWQTCRAEVDLAGATEVVDYYRENGPSALARTLVLNPNNPYGLEGYLAMLVGQRVPHARPYVPSTPERKLWLQYRDEFLLAAKRGFDVKQTLEAIRRPGWSWS
jgi:tryptophan halogenase